jgi:hypothetical protein
MSGPNSEFGASGVGANASSNPSERFRSIGESRSRKCSFSNRIITQVMDTDAAAALGS